MHLTQLLLDTSNFPTRDCYPFNLDVLQRTAGLSFNTPVTFFVGENGTGKSTLLRALAHKCDFQIWQDNERTRYRYNSHEDELYKHILVRWAEGPVPGSFFGSQIFQDFARFLDEWAASDPGILEYFGGQSLLTQSHGQSLITFFRARYKIKGLYLLDEPETALSPQSQLVLLKILQETTRGGHAQFIIASHSPILLAYPGATIYSFDHAPVKTIGYRETAYYRLYKDFLDRPEHYLSEIE
jgi:predicted ATPase